MYELIVVLWVGLLNLSVINSAQADEYIVDTEGNHAFIQFKIKHLGFSWMYGRFNQFSGHFSYDESNPSKSTVEITIETNSIDTNLAKRDKHLRSDDFLDVGKFPTASFISTSFKEMGKGKASVKGDFTFHGVSKNITINIEQVGHGKDPWGGYRRGFYGTASIKPAEFGLKKMDSLGPGSAQLFLELSLEGIRQAN